MGSYEIIITPDAEADLWELRNYIADVLLVPETAKSYVRRIREEIASLAEMPSRLKLRRAEPHRFLRALFRPDFVIRLGKTSSIPCGGCLV